MYCPSCHAEDTRVIDTRVIEGGVAIRRRRECTQCAFRFSTIEKIEILALQVDKADGTVQHYNQEKILRSLNIALRKRPVRQEQLKHAVHVIEQEIQSRARKDHISSQTIGEIVMRQLKKLDKVAYIRFASVYRSFADLHEFADELQKLSPRSKMKKSKK